MENTILLNADGTFPIGLDGNVSVFGAGKGRRQHKVVTGGSALPRLMNNLQLYDSSNIKGRGVGQPKPNLQRKPIKFII